MKAIVTVVVALLACVSAPSPALADVECSQPDGYGVQRCVAGLRSDRAATLFAQQKMNQWCWAASIAMVFKHHGYTVSQERIVREAWGTVVNMPGRPHEILGSLNRVWTDDHGRRFSVAGDVYTANPVTAAQDLAANAPLIIGTKGHAMVLTALHYQRNFAGQGSVTLATVRDPWPGMGRRDLRADEWFETMLLVRIRVTSLGGGDPGDGAERQRCRTVTTPCQHPAHPQGDAAPCTHPMHPQGDLVPCQHACPGPYGPQPCHPYGDAVPCQHQAHPYGDPAPCQHPAHPGGHASDVCD